MWIMYFYIIFLAAHYFSVSVQLNTLSAPDSCIMCLLLLFTDAASMLLMLLYADEQIQIWVFFIQLLVLKLCFELSCANGSTRVV